MNGRRWTTVISLLACAALAPACAKSANSRLERADDRAEKAREKDDDARQAANEAQKAKIASDEAHDDAAKAVRRERDDTRKRLQKEIAAIDAKLSPDKDKKQPAPSPAEQQALTQRRAKLGQDLDAASSGTDHEWPAIKARIDADLDAK